MDIESSANQKKIHTLMSLNQKKQDENSDDGSYDDSIDDTPQAMKIIKNVKETELTKKKSKSKNAT